ncbi:MAG: Zn-ribbon domain-containing OB-fold protein [Solirubrobacterales bacterium]
MTAPAAPERRFERGLEEGELLFQRCEGGHAWLPPRAHCPACLGDRFEWEVAGGAATLVSWVVYRRGFDPAWEDRLPYDVAVVELAEGPRLISNVVGIEGFEALRAGMELRLRVEREGGVALARFVPA